jgi:transcription elongation factor Elf1
MCKGDELMEILFNCPVCGYEEVYDVGEDIKHVDCGFCRDGVMDKVGICDKLPNMIKNNCDA